MSAPADQRFGRDYFASTYGVTRLKRFSQHWWSVRLYAGIAHRWLRRIGGRRVLDVGCGFGFILAALEKRYETYGIDVSAHAIEQCRRNTPNSRCLVADVEHDFPAQLQLGTFDLALACYVFEHLHDPQAAIHRCASLLRPGGILVYSVPNTQSLGARRKRDHWYARQDPTHYSLLPPEDWLRMTHAAGLTIRRESADGYWDLPYFRWLPTWLQAPIFVAPSALACLVARDILPARFGENIIVIAQRLPHAPPEQKAQQQ